MASDPATGLERGDSSYDFGTHLQQQLGVTRLELGECLTQYRPARRYPILLESVAVTRSDSAPFGLAAE
jgi:hypothetical protein